jgi:hypothetical protein
VPQCVKQRGKARRQILVKLNSHRRLVRLGLASLLLSKPQRRQRQRERLRPSTWESR